MSDAVEIFETSDIEEEENVIDENASIDSDVDTVDDESIERSKLDAQKAFERFQYFPYATSKNEEKKERDKKILDIASSE